jgi:AP-1-like transcription factor
VWLPNALANNSLCSQRAFRERKERHVKDLEAKLSALETSATSLASDNQRLKLALQRATTENEILRSQTTTSRLSTHASPGSDISSSSDTSPTADPTYSTSTPSWGGPGTEDRLLPAAATWDLIQSHPLVQQGHVDIADVCERLRGAARCDGSGPVFAEREVRRAVEESRRGGGDELI